MEESQKSELTDRQKESMKEEEDEENVRHQETHNRTDLESRQIEEYCIRVGQGHVGSKGNGEGNGRESALRRVRESRSLRESADRWHRGY